MNPLASVIALFAALKHDLTSRFNAALTNRPPLEQVEGANVAASVLRELEWGKERLERMGNELGTTLSAAATIIPGFAYTPGEAVEAAATRLIAQVEKNAADKAIADAIAAKSLIPIDDHNNALTAAKETAATEAKNQAEADFNSKLETIKRVSERRVTAIEKVGEIAAATLTDEVLAGDGFDAALSALEKRVATLTAENITPDGTRKAMFENLIAKSTEDEFTASLGLIKEAAGGKLAPLTADGKTVPPKPSEKGGAGFAGSTGDKKKVVC